MKNFILNDIKEIINQSLSYGSTGDRFIDNRYNLHKEKFDHYWPYYRTFWHLTKKLSPSLVVELGGWQGTAAAHFAGGNRKSTVVTIDHHGDPGDEEHKILMRSAESHYKNLHYIQGWTWNVVDRVKEYGSIDILFIDSWHQYEYAMRDWELYFPLLSNVSLIICDDIIGGDGPVISGMLDFWEELPGEKFLENRIHPGVPMGFIRYDKS